jgi:hypothetical protein
MVVENSVILDMFLRLSGIKTGLLINFNSRLLHQGIKRFVL